MNTRTNFLLGMATGIMLCVTGLAAWHFLPSLLAKDRPREISFEQSISSIRSKEVKEVVVKGDEMELIAASGEKFITKLDASDATRNEVLNAARESGTTIKLESASTGYGWLVIIQALPLLLFLGLAFIATASLAILAWKALFNKKA